MTSGINFFGSLTTQNGQRLTFKDFDENGDGTITQEEYDATIKEYGLDSVELSTVDSNGDNVIDEDEFEIYEQKAQMQDALNDLQATIARDFCGKYSQYITDVNEQLKEFAQDFAANYIGVTDKMAEAFKEQLPAKYQEIKTNVMENTTEYKQEQQNAIKDNVLDDLYEKIEEKAGGNLSDSQLTLLNQFVSTVETMIDNYIKTYTGDNFETDLTEYLINTLSKSDAEKMSDAISAWNAGTNSIRGYISSSDLDQLKEYAAEFLQAALDNGISITLGGTKVTSSNISSVLSKYSDGTELKNAIQTIIDELSTVSQIEDIIAEIENKPEEEAAQAAKEAEAAFAALKGSDVQIDTTLIDLSEIDGYFDNSKVTVKGEGKYGAKDDAVEFLTTNLKDQFKAQIEKTLEAKGISWEQFETTFENIFSKSAWDAADECVSGHRRVIKRNTKSYFNTADLVNSFIEKFNTNIVAAIDDMNSSNTDMDLYDIDYSVIYTDEDGNEDKTTKTAFEDGNSVICAVGLNAKETVETKAKATIEKLKSQMLTKARAMCEANGVEFDNDAFNTIFKNSESYAVSQSVTSSGSGRFEVVRFNPQKAVTEFTTTFKEYYSAWVDTQKASV